MKVKKNMKAFKICSQNVHLRRVSNIDIMTKTQRERMMNFANYKKRKPPIWYDDVLWDGYCNDVL